MFGVFFSMVVSGGGVEWTLSETYFGNFEKKKPEIRNLSINSNLLYFHILFVLS